MTHANLYVVVLLDPPKRVVKVPDWEWQAKFKDGALHTSTVEELPWQCGYMYMV
jgi:hypothetical protein